MEGTMKTWYFVIDVEKCENCKNCFLACKDEYVGNDWPGYSGAMPDNGPSWIATPGVERGQYPFIDVAYLPTPCMHCDNAPCMKAANGAIYKRPDGIVIIDPGKAKGQKQLPSACPYGVITWNDALDLPQKCTFCAHLIDEGWTKTRCVQSCPTFALTLRHVEEAEMKEIVAAENLELYHPEYTTHPRVYYKNLHRFTRCFIGGSVAVRRNGQDECVKGATVTLSKGSETVGACITDTFGDFKFDHLEANSGAYTLQIAHPGHDTKILEVRLPTRAYVGIVWL
jgi:Fe-S-cluster-containing dehydrogenase component